jgi:hypothetical protein
MSLYIVTRKADGVEVYRYNADAPIAWGGMPFNTHDHTLQPDPVVPPAPEPAPVRITKFAFRSRFSQAEKVGIEIAALDDPAASMEQRAQAAALRASQDDIAVAEFVNLNLPATRDGVLALEAVGLLTPGRALEILDTAPTEDEVFNG